MLRDGMLNMINYNIFYPLYTIYVPVVCEYKYSELKLPIKHF